MDKLFVSKCDVFEKDFEIRLYHFMSYDDPAKDYLEGHLFQNGKPVKDAIKHKVSLKRAKESAGTGKMRDVYQYWAGKFSITMGVELNGTYPPIKGRTRSFKK